MFLLIITIAKQLKYNTELKKKNSTQLTDV